MVSLSNPFRWRGVVTTGFEIDELEPTTLPDDITRLLPIPPKPRKDPVRAALFAQVAFVSVGDNPELHLLLPEDLPAEVVKRIVLPRNPRSADSELYELDSMDLIVIVQQNERSVSKDAIRWMQILKRLGIPMMVVLPYTVTKRAQQEKIDHFSQVMGLPVVVFAPDKLESSREVFVEKAMQLAPAGGLALAAKFCDFRFPLMQTVLQNAVVDAQNADSRGLSHVQKQMIRQICAAYDCNGNAYQGQEVALGTLAKSLTYYTEKIIRRVPRLETKRRDRLTRSVSTLLVGYATAIHLGAEPPALRREMLPQLWRLYRASRQPATT